jgi:hypothetical protein
MKINIVFFIVIMLIFTSLFITSCNKNSKTPSPISIPPGMIRLNMKSYGNHDELSYSDKQGEVPYDQRILSIKPVYVVDNPPHGLYGEMSNPQYEGTWFLTEIERYHEAGIKVFGYISGGYEGSGGGDDYETDWYSIDINLKLIDNMAKLDRVDGIFIDECSDFPNEKSKKYLKQLTKLAHSYGLLVWGNTGVDDFDEWYFTKGGFDLMQSSEDWQGQELSPVQKKWGSRISVTGFNKSYTAQDAFRLTVDAWEKGLALCYINDSEYTSIAPWFEEYVELLEKAQKNQ